ncbi:MAG: protein phosphatase [Gammaproteobacteria bacterium]|nr:MAG: protein phosphatase [Pseudomonadota bacterium]PIE38088.1 MAG: protein phosphatase [Gammaproteobacteria bacterium]
MIDENKRDDKETLLDFEIQLRDQAANLKHLVDSGNYPDALKVISELNQTRDMSLYQEVGRLTRSLHEAIRSFHIDSKMTQSQQDEMSKMEDASDRLSYVIDMTSKAANRTMDLVEESMPIASGMKQEAESLKDGWGRLRRREMPPEEFREFYKKVDVFLEKMSVQSDKVYCNLSDILLAQDFQDLTGQAIQKVTALVTEVEANLVALVKMAGQLDKLTGTEHIFEQKDNDVSRGEGPQMKAEERTDVVSSQDDVDDLLSSLGF